MSDTLTPSEQSVHIDLLTKQLNSLLAENKHLAETIANQDLRIKDLSDTIRMYENQIDDQSADIRSLGSKIATLEDKESIIALKESVRKLYDTAFATMSVLQKHF